jgi:hypothetical protein
MAACQHWGEEVAVATAVTVVGKAACQHWEVAAATDAHVAGIVACAEVGATKQTCLTKLVKAETAL